MNIQQLNLAISLSNNLKTDVLSVDAIRRLLKLSNGIEKDIKEFQEVEKKILESYNIEPNQQGLVSWKGHKKENEITAKIAELRNTEYDLKPINFMEENEFFESSKGMKLSEISFLQKLMVKE